MGIRLIVQHQGDEVELSLPEVALVVPHKGLARVDHGTALDLVDTGTWLVLPPGAVFRLSPVSPVCHTVLLLPTRGLTRRTIDVFRGEMDPGLLDGYLRAPALLPRTVWMNEICHRYVFERAVRRQRHNGATRFLETEVIRELYNACEAPAARRERKSLVVGKSLLVARAVELIELHLFEPDVLARTLAGVGASSSTLLRAFKRERLGTPKAYVRARRLDEARLLLRSRRYAVGEVAALVGYENSPAFSAAFRARFGKTPSQERGE